MPLRTLCSALLLALATPALAGSFTYRGQLQDDGAAANGRYDLQFRLYADAAGRQPLGPAIEMADVQVSDGQFAVALELPETVADSGWLEVAVRPVEEAAYWPLPDRQAVALKAGMCPAAWELGGNAGTVASMNFLGTTDNQPLVLRSNNQQVGRLQMVNDEVGPTANVVFGAPANAIRDGVFGATILGGGGPSTPNEAHDHFATIGGGRANVAGSANADLVDGGGATVSGGIGNLASGPLSTIAGGNSNAAEGTVAVVGGGSLNSAAGLATTIGGGGGNVVNGDYATVAGGVANVASGEYSSIAGGEENAARGSKSVVPGGRYNCAGADHSWAGGQRAKVRPKTAADNDDRCDGVEQSATGDIGTFVWADSQAQDFVSSGRDQFLIRATGGVGINAAPPVNSVELSVTADNDGADFANLFLRQRSNSAGILFSSGGATSSSDNNAAFFIDHFNGSAQARRMAMNSDGSVLIRSNITGANSGVTMAAGSGSWSSLSDRRLKTAIAAIDPRLVLDRLLEVPISHWSYLTQGGIRHIGPMAQDFAAAFGVGENDTTISSIDADGVALAAIQGLNSKLEQENATLRGRLDQLVQELAELRRRVDAADATGGR